MKLLPDPTPAQVRNLARESRRGLLLVVGECRVDHEAQSRTGLAYGKRLVARKGDGTLMVHRNEGSEPVYALPPPSRVEFLVEGGRLVVAARRERERLRIVFREVEMASAHALVDEAPVRPAGLEPELARLERNPHLIEPGLRISRRRRETRGGAADLFGYDREFRPVLISVKRGEAPVTAAYHLDSIAAEFRRQNPRARVRSILVAARVPKRVRAALERLGLEWREVERGPEAVDEKQQRLQRFFR